MGTTYYFLPTRNLFGEDSVKETGELMKSLGGKKAMIVTDGFLAKSREWHRIFRKFFRIPEWRAWYSAERSPIPRM